MTDSTPPNGVTMPFKSLVAFSYLRDQIELATLGLGFVDSRRALLGCFGGYANAWGARCYWEQR